ncbi:PREDICTED: carbon catabolite repressor protein 4 homolog 2-like isoform X2 [Tarenaya hassleriana]|uniref:carbon catabolite repressor protein 4 homolog 2-like isoform X2 n=1 Tax=Tarenaya hassleriana TaxID=28532 RepID=UPI00053C7274|nr:PREDICTED: carbon catabolite repressor protein 4 homolog 2-like isoform X2 [Tarenaya hassleriana]
MLSVFRLELPLKTPIAGRELTPKLLVRRPDRTITADDVPESAPLEGHFLRYRWYRVHSYGEVIYCSVHPSERATSQCQSCSKYNTLTAMSYHCSPECFSNAWYDYHRVVHEQATKAAAEKKNVDDELRRYLSSTFGSFFGSVSNPNLSNVSATPNYIGGERLVEVGCSRTYTPMDRDIGHVLRMIPVEGIDQDDGLTSAGSFTLLSYNILSESSADGRLYNYCPPWALSWPYRSQELLREIVGYRADVVCLQEVQSDHFDDFFRPELYKHGYEALYKRRTDEVFSGNVHRKIDGCATFFRADRFSCVRKYDVEFNRAAWYLAEAVIPSDQKTTALDRLVKDNVALIVVLEAKFGNQCTDASGKRQYICVANAHVVNIDQELKDVKLWQVFTLLKGLEKIASHSDIPTIVCGDLNSFPGSAAHYLLSTGMIHPLHLDFEVDPLGILHPKDRLTHQLPLVSAYASFMTRGTGRGSVMHSRRMDCQTNEPQFTHCSRAFLGTYDYIFYTADTLRVEALLELLDLGAALPSSQWPSSHLALMAEFRLSPKTRSPAPNAKRLRLNASTELL